MVVYLFPHERVEVRRFSAGRAAPGLSEVECEFGPARSPDTRKRITDSIEEVFSAMSAFSHGSG